MTLRGASGHPVVIDKLSADQGNTYGFRHEAESPSLRSLLTHRNKINDRALKISELLFAERTLLDHKDAKGTERNTISCDI